MKEARIEHEGHEIRAQVQGDSVLIQVDGISAGRAVWRGHKIHQRPTLLSFQRGLEPGLEREERETRAALRRDESDEIYARLETSLAALATAEET